MATVYYTSLETAHGPECAECVEGLLYGLKDSLDRVKESGTESRGYRRGGDHHVRVRVTASAW